MCFSGVQMQEMNSKVGGVTDTLAALNLISVKPDSIEKDRLNMMLVKMDGIPS